MAITQVVFADVSRLTVAGTQIEACTAFQASRGADQRPIYTWGQSKPRQIISTPGIGQGSFSFIASDGTGSGGAQDFSTILTGTQTIGVAGTASGNMGAVTLSFNNCSFAGQSQAMNAKNEMVVTVNFTFPAGTF